jgi:uncharacterized protein YjbI with pentapeptide repeats/predicted transcriptional regulator
VANEEHLAEYKKGCESWNLWRSANPSVQPDLSRLDFKSAILEGFNFSNTDFSRTKFFKATFSNVDLQSAKFSEAELIVTVFINANFSNANLQNSSLNASLAIESDFSSADLTGASLEASTFIGANFNSANFKDSSLESFQAPGADFSFADLTGTHVINWNISNETNLDNVICDYVYLQGDCSDRRPSDPDTIFAPGEFAQLFQKALNTVDLVFTKGINWQAFFRSFQELRSRFDEDDISIQAIEKKSGGDFVIRLEVPPGAIKAAIERQAKELYERDRLILEAQYRERLNAKDEQIEIYKKQSSVMAEIVKLQATRPIQLEEPKVTLQPTQIKILQAIQDGEGDSDAVAVAANLSTDTVEYYLTEMNKDGYVRYFPSLGDVGSCSLTSKGRVALTNPDLLLSPRSEGSFTQTFNNYLNGANIANFANQVRESASQNASQFSQAIGQNADEITRLITTLREQSQQFPEDQRDAAQIALDDLQQDLTVSEKIEPKRLKQRLISLLLVLGWLGSTVVNAADFANNALELVEKSGIPKSELLQYVPTHLLPPPSSP